MSNLGMSYAPQKISESKKTQEWHEKVIDNLISRSMLNSFNSVNHAYKKRVNYNLYNGVLNKDDFEYVLNPFDVEDSFPSTLRNYNLIKTRVDFLIGEELKRADRFKVLDVNPDAISMKQKEKFSVYVQTLNEKIKARYAESGLLEPEVDEEGNPIEGQFKTPAEIEEYFKNGYKSVNEVAAYKLLRSLKEKLNLQKVFIDGFRDGLIAGEEIYYTSVVNSNPFIERINPIDFEYDRHPNIEFIDESSWAVRRAYMTIATIHDRFGEYMKGSDLDKLESEYGGEGSEQNTGGKVNYTLDRIRNLSYGATGSDLGDTDVGSDRYIPVYHTVWISFKKVGIVMSENEEGVMDTFLVDESYIPLENDIVEWTWVRELRQGTKIGSDIFINCGADPNQVISLDNLNSVKLPYTGIAYSSVNNRTTSMVDMMKPYQYLYNIVKYRLELALARDKGKVLLMDLTQIPKSMNIDVNKWLYYLSAMGIAFINPYEEGSGADSRGGAAAAFNQFQAVDMGLSAVINEYVGLLSKIEQDLGTITGLTQQRMGQISQNELVANAQANILQSSNITEYIFFMHNQVKRRIYTNLLECAKFAYHDGHTSQMFMDDGTLHILQLTRGQLLFSNMDVYVTDNATELQNLDTLKQFAGHMLQAGASVSMAAEIITSDNVNVLKTKIKNIEELQQANAQAAQEAEAAKEAELLQMKLQSEAERNRIIEEDSIRKSNTSLEIALINAEAKVEGNAVFGTGEETNFELDLDSQKLQLERDRLNEDVRKRYSTEQLAREKMAVDSMLKQKEMESKEKIAKSKPKGGSK